MATYEEHLEKINTPKQYCNACKDKIARFILTDLMNNQSMDLCETCRDEIVELARERDIDFEIKHISNNSQQYLKF